MLIINNILRAHCWRATRVVALKLKIGAFNLKPLLCVVSLLSLMSQICLIASALLAPISGDVASKSAISSSPSASSNSNISSPVVSFAAELLRRQHSQHQAQHSLYRTHYACDGSSLDLSCEDKKLLHLVRANYGRFSLSICNDFGHTNLSVHCTSFRAFLIMETRCNNLNNCSVPVSTDLFGDPCEESSKYLEVQYYCKEDADSKASFAPQLPLMPTTRNNEQQQQQLLQSNEQLATATVIQTQQQQPQAQLATQFQPQLLRSSTDFCPQTTSARNLVWPATRKNVTAKRGCPEGWRGVARWYCSAQSASERWSAQGPDFSDCQSNWLSNLANERLASILAIPSSVLTNSVEIAQRESALALIMGELAVIAKTRELFAADLRLTLTTLSTIFAHSRTLAAQAALAAATQPTSTSAQQQQQQQQQRNFIRSTNYLNDDNLLPQTTLDASSISNSNNNPLLSSIVYAESALRQCAQIVSALLDSTQRNAWLQLSSADERRLLVQRALDLTRDFGAHHASFKRDQSADFRPLLAAFDNALVGVFAAQPAQDFRFPQVASELPQFGSSMLASDDSKLSIVVPEAVIAQLAANGEFAAPKLVVVAFKVDASLQFDNNNNNNNNDSQQTTIAGLFAITSASSDNDAQLSLRLDQLSAVGVSFKLDSPATRPRVCLAIELSGARSTCRSTLVNESLQQCRCAQFAYYLMSTQSSTFNSDSSVAESALSAATTTTDLQQQQQSQISTQRRNARTENNAPIAGWTALAIALCLAIAFVGIAGLLIGASMRAAAAKSALNKKHYGDASGSLFFTPNDDSSTLFQRHLYDSTLTRQARNQQQHQHLMYGNSVPINGASSASNSSHSYVSSSAYYEEIRPTANLTTKINLNDCKHTIINPMKAQQQLQHQQQQQQQQQHADSSHMFATLYKRQTIPEPQIAVSQPLVSPQHQHQQQQQHQRLAHQIQFSPQHSNSQLLTNYNASQRHFDCS